MNAQSEYTETSHTSEESEYTDHSNKTEESEYTDQANKTEESEYTDQANTTEKKTPIEDHEIIHARMVVIFRKVIIFFAGLLLIISALFTYFADISLYLTIGLFVFSIFFPAFIYRISIKTIRNYPL